MPSNKTRILGSGLPLARTKAERMAKGDPRPSIEERSSGTKQYLQMYRKAADRLVDKRFLLLEDLPAIVERGSAEWDFAVK